MPKSIKKVKEEFPLEGEEQANLVNYLDDLISKGRNIK
jgi:hypothetical protein